MSKPVKVRPAQRKNAIPESITSNSELNAAIAVLPVNYNFEIHKTIWKITSDNSIKSVALQFPEGLLMYGCIIADIIESFAFVKVIILGDVTFGACCIDDFTAAKLGANYLIHYGHSCLVPITDMRIPVLYVFVEIRFDASHLIECIKESFDSNSKLAIMGTIQFVSAVHETYTLLKGASFDNVYVPQGRPLSSGETLGCTSPILPHHKQDGSEPASDSEIGTDAIIFIADGRFHLESAMIQNPLIPAYRYDPYSKVMTSEGYDTATMKKMRWAALSQAKTATTFGIIVGTLGRQGSLPIFHHLRKLLQQGSGDVKVIPFLMAEINSAKLKMVTSVQAWVQIACPRLSIDWSNASAEEALARGESLPLGASEVGSSTSNPVPILTPYECAVMRDESLWQEVYPMDFYRQNGGPWGNMYHRPSIVKGVLQPPPATDRSTRKGKKIVLEYEV